MKNFIKNIALLLIGGAIYILIELSWRGHSHISMFFVGGLCFLAIGAINEFIPWEMGFIQQCYLGACFTTCIEFFSGVVLNIWLGWNVWDYSHLPFNLLGQICLPFFFAWMALSAVGIVLDDYLRYWLFDEEKPHYTLI